MKAFKDGKKLHRKYVLQMLLQTYLLLKELPTLVDIPVPDGTKVFYLFIYFAWLAVCVCVCVCGCVWVGGCTRAWVCSRSYVNSVRLKT